jgi:hypothetical protein
MIGGGGSAIVNESVAVAGVVPCESDKVKFSMYVPPCDGTPLISPVVLSCKSGGSCDVVDH